MRIRIYLAAGVSCRRSVEVVRILAVAYEPRVSAVEAYEPGNQVSRDNVSRGLDGGRIRFYTSPYRSCAAM